jgi:alpha-L-fucosidase
MPQITRRKPWIAQITTAALTLLVFAAAVAAASPPAAESPAERDARMKWWREARFGMFIHWGVYANPAGEFGG